jgi:hypothetical protein
MTNSAEAGNDEPDRSFGWWDMFVVPDPEVVAQAWDT